MHTNNIIELLKTFSSKDLKQFSDFLNSPFFNKRKAVIRLYEVISGFHPDYENKLPSKEVIFQKLFPGKKYKDATFRVLMHYLSELAERYIAHSGLEKDRLEFFIRLQHELHERKQYKLLNKNVDNAFKYFEKLDLEAEVYFFYKYNMENYKTYYLFESHYALFEKFIEETNFENVFKYLSNFYILKSMILYLNTLNLHTVYNKDFETESFRSMFQKINADDYKELPVIQMYYYIIKMLIDGDEHHFYKVKEILKANRNIFNIYDITGAYVNLNNYCQKKITSGNARFEKERFDIYREELTAKTYLMNDGFMSPIFYKNVISCGLALKEYSWIKNFIYKYKPELNKKYRDNYFYSNLAQYEFCTGNYESSLVLNSKVRFDELYMKLNSKVLHMQILYETCLEDSLISSIESFRHFLTNNKLIPSLRKSGYSNFHKYLNKIILHVNKKDKNELGLLYKNLSKENNVINKIWLMEKIINVKL